MKKPKLALTIAITEHVDGVVPVGRAAEEKKAPAELWKEVLYDAMGFVSRDWHSVRWCKGTPLMYVTGDKGMVCFVLKRAPKTKAKAKVRK